MEGTEMKEDLISVVKAAAIEVYRTLGAGYEERIYEEAMAVEFRKRGIPYQVERNAEVIYKGEKVGIHRLDFVVNEELVVELKSATSISKGNVAQTASYLRTLKVPKALLINFPYPERDEPEIQLIEV